MGLKHRRAPSAMATLTKMTKEEEVLLFSSNLTFDPPPQESRQNFKGNSSHKKFFHSASISSNNEFCSFLSSSVEGFIEDLNTLQDYFQINEVVNTETNKKNNPDPLFELKIVIMDIKAKRASFKTKQEKVKKSLKLKLWKIFKDRDYSSDGTERRRESLRASGDTVQGPGSFYLAE